jgi:hypothetical protein
MPCLVEDYYSQPSQLIPRLRGYDEFPIVSYLDQLKDRTVERENILLIREMAQIITEIMNCRLKLGRLGAKWTAASLRSSQ